MIPHNGYIGWCLLERFHSLEDFFLDECGLNPAILFVVVLVHMSTQTIIQHVAVEYADVSSADAFFIKVLGIPKVKSTLLPQELSASIFNISQAVQMETYDNGTTRVEVFITPEPVKSSFVHIGIAVDHASEFVTRCQQQGLRPFFVQKEKKQLLFVRDFSGNLFEVIEQ
jgi:catechol 2,3-dioxygenase-like lactoylglutathione lyase family enzyme